MPRNVLTLMDKVERAKEYGLAQQPVQQLAEQAGRTTAPSTATETGVLGGTPQQQAMAGTPAQQQAAIKQQATRVGAPRGETQLEQAQTFQTAQETTGQQMEKERAKQLVAGLGTFGAKVSEWVSGIKQKLTGTKAELAVDTSGDLFKGVKPENIASLTEKLKQVAVERDPATRASLENDINTLLPADAAGTPRTVDTVLSPEQKAKLYSDVQKSISTAVTAGRESAIGADRKITLSDLTNLGTTQAEVASLLGIPEGEVGNLTISGLQNKISEISQQQFNTTQQIQAGLSSSFLSSADRAALRGYLRDVEQTGEAGAETAVANLASDIDKGRQVTFGGKRYSVEELLESEALNDLVTQVLKDPTGPIAKQVATAEPDFAKWITDNQKDLTNLVTASQKASTEYGAMQKGNVAALGVIGTKFPTLSKSLGYDPKALRAGAIDPASLPGVFQSLAQMEPGQQEAAGGVLTSLNKAAPNAVKDLTKEQVDNLDLTNPNGPAARYITAANDQKAADKLTSPQDVANEFLSTDMSIEQIDAALTGDNLAAALNLPTSNVGELDTNKDGKFDEKDVSGLKSKINTTLPSLADVANGAQINTTRNSLRVDGPKIPRDAAPLFDVVSASLKDKTLTPDEIDAISKTTIPSDSLQDMINRLQAAPVPFRKSGGVREVRNTLAQKLDTQISNEMTGAYAAVGLSSQDISAAVNIRPQSVEQFQPAIDTLNNMVSQLRRAADIAPSKSAKDRIQNQIRAVEASRDDKQRQKNAADEASKSAYDRAIEESAAAMRGYSGSGRGGF